MDHGDGEPRGARIAALIVGVFAAILLAAFAPVLVVARSFDVGGFVTPFVIEVPFTAVGFLIARRRPRNPIGWMLLIGSVCAVLSSDAGYWAWAVYGTPHRALPLGPLAVLLGQLGAPFVGALAPVILLFPDGRLPSRRWRAVLVPFAALGVVGVAGLLALAGTAIAAHRLNANTVSPGGGSLIVAQPPGTAWLGDGLSVFILAAGLLLLAALAQQAAALRRSTGVERLQRTSLMYGAAICGLSVIVFVSGTANAGSSLVSQIWSQVPWIALSALPLSIAVAILRHRLYDVDRLVSRTLSYAILTGLLVGTFIGVVALSTDVLPLSSRVGVAASTLVAAALFNPLRVRIQRAVDRRFNRTRYDAEQVAAALSARLRDAVELDAIRGDLLDAVRRAVQPTHASVWIRR